MKIEILRLFPDGTVGPEEISSNNPLPVVGGNVKFLKASTLSVTASGQDILGGVVNALTSRMIIKNTGSGTVYICNPSYVAAAMNAIYQYYKNFASVNHGVSLP